NFADAVAILVARPFLMTGCMADCFVISPGGRQVVISPPFVRVDRYRSPRFAHDKGFEFFAVGMLHHPQTDMAALSTNHACYGRTVVVEGAVSALFVGATTRRVLRIKVRTAFLTRVLIHLVGFDHGIGKCRGGKGAP